MYRGMHVSSDWLWRDARIVVAVDPEVIEARQGIVSIRGLATYLGAGCTWAPASSRMDRPGCVGESRWGRLKRGDLCLEF